MTRATESGRCGRDPVKNTGHRDFNSRCPAGEKPPAATALADLARDPLGQAEVTLSVELGDVGPAVAEHDLCGHQAVAAADLGRVVVPELVWMPAVRPPPHPQLRPPLRSQPRLPLRQRLPAPPAAPPEYLGAGQPRRRWERLLAGSPDRLRVLAGRVPPARPPPRVR